MVPINHCEMRDQIKEAGLGKEDFMEAVLERAGAIVITTLAGKGAGKPHKYPGVELAAMAVANHVINEGANKVAADLEVPLDDLKTQGASKHISWC